MSKPRIVHVYKDYYPPVVGGIEKTINLMAEGLRGDFDIRVIVANRAPRRAEETINGIPILKVASRGRFASAPLAPDYVRALRETPADIWHFHCPNPTGDLAWLWAKPPGRVVVTYHSDIVRQRWALWAYGPFLRRFLRRADVIMPTSPNYIESSPWLRPERGKCRVVPLGIPLGRFAATPEIESRARAIREQILSQSDSEASGIILFVGKFRYYKGLQFLLPALRVLPGARLVLVGEGPMRAKLEPMARALQIADRVHWAGEVSDDDLPAWFRAADVFCMPSHLRSEAFGISQIEAMACGLPVVSCNLASGVPFVNRDGESGLTVEPGQWRPLADALQTLLTNDDLRHRLAAGAHTRAHREFSDATMCERVGEVYEDTLSAPEREK